MSKKLLSFETRDEFHRKPIAEKVVRLLESDTTVSPMVIDGSWGTGKTEFCQKLIHLIENSESNLTPVYIDAFKADHTDEPLMTVLSAILKLLPAAERPPLMQAALPVAKFGLKTALKAGVSWVLKQDADKLGEDLTEDLKSAGDQAVNYAVESLLTEHVEAEEKIETLKQALAQVSEASPIVIFIDELDRCRPSFAVSMLESIKHVFDVNHVQFVLVTNSSQLRASINHCYGNAVEAHRYLDKFIAFSFRLPDSYKPDGYRIISASKQHMHTLIANSESLAPRLHQGAPQGFLDQLIDANQLSLREVETLCQHLEIYQSLTNGEGFTERLIHGYCLFRVLGVFLFCFKPTVCEQLSRGIVDAKEISAVLGKFELIDISQDDYPNPDQGDVITAIVGAEANRNREGFYIEDQELIKKWNEFIKSFFHGGGFPPEVGERVKIAVSAIETLQLGGN